MPASTPTPYRLVVFDWDGTLADSIPAIVDCTHAALAVVDRFPLPPLAAIRGAIGLGLRDSLAQFFPEAEEEFITALTAAYRFSGSAPTASGSPSSPALARPWRASRPPVTCWRWRPPEPARARADFAATGIGPLFRPPLR